MPHKSKLRSWLGALLFVTGVLLGLALSGSVTMGESEAWLYTSNNADARLRLRCPYMLAPKEQGTVSAKITNLTNEDIKPVVSARVSHASLPREVEQTISLRAKESKTVEWAVNSEDVIYGHLVLVNVTQERYRDNPSRFGSCGILLYSLFGLRGTQTFGGLFGISLIAMLFGGRLWLNERRQPLTEFSINLTQINKVLMTITILALLSMLPRWWGLTLFFDTLILLMSGVIFTDFVLTSKYKN